jgi:hypothetical protein
MNRTTRHALLAFTIALLPAVGVCHAAGTPASAAQLSFIALPASYADLYGQILAKQGAVAHLKAGDRLGLSAIACRLTLRTPSAGLRDQAAKLLEQALTDPAFDLADFHTLRVFGEHVWRMKQAGLLTPQLRQWIADAVRKHFASPAFQNGLRGPLDPTGNNITQARLYGYAGLLKYFEGEELPQRAALTQLLQAHCDFLFKIGDLDEDASNYDSLGLAHFVDIVRLLGRERELKASAGFRRLFERMRDIVSPTGLIPEYGDAYFTYSGCPLDRVYLLEYAARLYVDPTFLYAARKLYQRPNLGLPEADIWARALPLINLERLPAEPVPPAGPPSRVTYRRHYQRVEDDVDKLILRTGLEPGSAMIMLDVYAQGSHSHPEKGPSIAYYEADGVPLFHNLGRHGTRSSVAGNLLFALPAAEPFPGCFNRPDVWNTMSIPVAYLSESPTLLKAEQQEAWNKAHAAAQMKQHYLAGSFSLRNFPEYNHDCEHLFFDNLRLSGPGGERLIDGFEVTAGAGNVGWSKVAIQDGRATQSPDHTEGQFSQRLDWRRIKGGPTRVFPVQPASPEEPVDESRYTHLKLDLKFTGKRPYMHIRGLGTQVDLGDQLLLAQPRAARVEQRRRDAFGEIQYAAYIERDCRLTRRFVLTDEGYLVIQDELVPGKNMDGWNAGQLWQLYELQDRGANWYCSASDGEFPQGVGPQGAKVARRMLVRYAENGASKTGVETIEKKYHCPAPNGRVAKQFFTTFSYRPVIAQQKITFAMIVVPQDLAGRSPADAAGKIRITQAPDGMTTAEVAGKNTVQITLTANQWEVKR